MSDCVFCKIIKGDIPSEKLFENEDMIIIKDINPKAKKHYLLIPKEHYPLLDCLDEIKACTLAKCLMKLKELKDALGLEQGYRIVINQGESAGQTVPHLHLHILGGETLTWD